MLNKIHKTLDETCEKVNGFMGVSVELPKPSKRAIKISATTNGVVGASLIAFGVLSSHKWTILLGGLGLTSSLLMKYQNTRNN